jgi:hypothetical protein
MVSSPSLALAFELFKLVLRLFGAGGAASASDSVVRIGVGAFQLKKKADAEPDRAATKLVKDTVSEEWLRNEFRMDSASAVRVVSQVAQKLATNYGRIRRDAIKRKNQCQRIDREFVLDHGVRDLLGDLSEQEAQFCSTLLDHYSDVLKENVDRDSDDFGVAVVEDVAVLERRVEQHDSDIQDLREQLTPSTGGTLETALAFVEWERSMLLAWFRNDSLASDLLRECPDEQILEKIESINQALDVWVETTGSKENETDEKPKPAETTPETNAEARRPSQIVEESYSVARVNAQRIPQPWDRYYRQHADDNVLLLGDGGFGKTWLLSLYGLRAANSFIDSCAGGAVPSLPVPVVVSCRRIDELTGASIQVRVAQWASSACQTDVAEIVRAFALFGLRLFLDGLDEVQQAQKKESLTTLLHEWCQADSRGSAMVSSRPSSVGSPSGLREFQRCYVRPLVEDQCLGFARLWPLDPGILRKLTSEMTRATPVSVSLRTPLILSATCRALQGQDASCWPLNNTELWRLIVDSLVAARHRIVHAAAPTAADLMATERIKSIATMVAWSAQASGQSPGRASFSTKALIRLGRELFGNAADASAVADGFVGSGLTSKNGEDFEFVHTSIEEFFRARALGLVIDPAAFTLDGANWDTVCETDWRQWVQERMFFGQQWNGMWRLLGVVGADIDPYINWLMSLDPDPFFRALQLAIVAVAHRPGSVAIDVVVNRVKRILIECRGYHEWPVDIARSLAETPNIDDALISEFSGCGVGDGRALAWQVCGFRETSESLELLRTFRFPSFQVIRALGCRREPEAAAKLRALASDPRFAEAFEAFNALSAHPGDSVTRFLASVVTSDRSLADRRSALEALVGRDGDEARKVVRACAASEVRSLRRIVTDAARGDVTLLKELGAGTGYESALRVGIKHLQASRSQSATECLVFLTFSSRSAKVRRGAASVLVARVARALTQFLVATALDGTITPSERLASYRVMDRITRVIPVISQAIRTACKAGEPERQHAAKWVMTLISPPSVSAVGSVLDEICGRRDAELSAGDQPMLDLERPPLISQRASSRVEEIPTDSAIDDWAVGLLGNKAIEIALGAVAGMAKRMSPKIAGALAVNICAASSPSDPRSEKMRLAAMAAWGVRDNPSVLRTLANLAFVRSTQDQRQDESVQAIASAALEALLRTDMSSILDELCSEAKRQHPLCLLQLILDASPQLTRKDIVRRLEPLGALSVKEAAKLWDPLIRYKVAYMASRPVSGWHFKAADPYAATRQLGELVAAKNTDSITTDFMEIATRMWSGFMAYSKNSAWL